MHKRSLREFLAQNPFPQPLTQGFFYREKMRAIHAIAPDLPFEKILEVGGGQSGLTTLLYPNADIVNLDLNPDYAQATRNQNPHVSFVCGDATALPFADDTFDAITLFDVLEHIPNDAGAIAEALRVLKPGGYLLISTPNEHWRFPYYGVMKPLCPPEVAIMAEWGHVRRGYSLSELQTLISLPCQQHHSFINPLTVVCHDVAFSQLSARKRKWICRALSPLTWVGYALHHANSHGTETASVWQQPRSLALREQVS